jgi:hypothetical protein
MKQVILIFVCILFGLTNSILLLKVEKDNKMGELSDIYKSNIRVVGYMFIFVLIALISFNSYKMSKPDKERGTYDVIAFVMCAFVCITSGILIHLGTAKVKKEEFSKLCLGGGISQIVVTFFYCIYLYKYVPVYIPIK